MSYANLPEVHRAVLQESVLVLATAQRVKGRLEACSSIHQYIADVLHPMVDAPATAQMVAEAAGIRVDLGSVIGDLVVVSQRYEQLAEAMENYRLE